MDAPEIRYCRTSDGVSIAYWTVGAGPPIVDMGPPPFSHIGLEWQLPEMREWYLGFARSHQLVRFDGRGTGLSEREIAAYSLDGLVLDLEAVLDRLELASCILIGQVNSGAAAITFAARHPERVDKLILWCAYSMGTEFFDDSGTRVLRDMVNKDWEMFVETSAHSRFGWSGGEPAQRFADLIRKAVEPGVQSMLMDALRAVDVRDVLGQVQAPTLVMQREDRGVDMARRIAEGVQNGRLVMFKGNSAAPYLDDVDRVRQAIAEFLGEEVVSPPQRERGGLMTILFTDIESSTALARLLGDAKAQAVRHAHNAIVREALAACGGREIKHTGDGIMASFPSASRALECAVAIQRSVEERAAPNLGIHIGANAGEPVAEEEDLFGTSVDMARRICDHAAGGEILVSDVVRQLVAGKDFRFADAGEVVLKGIEEPVRLWAVR